MMGDIYRQASEVYAWLGDGDADTDYALDYITKLQHGQRDIAKEKAVDQYLKPIFWRPYFQRAWVVQECALNPLLNAVCGEYILKWESLSAALPSMAERTRIDPFGRDTTEHTGHPAAIGKGWYEIDQLRRTMRCHIERPDIYKLVLAFGYTQCADLADKIYAFLALPHQSHGITADYNQPSLGAMMQLLSSVTLGSNDMMRSSYRDQLAANDTASRLSKESLRMLCILMSWWNLVQPILARLHSETRQIRYQADTNRGCGIPDTEMAHGQG